MSRLTVERMSTVQYLCIATTSTLIDHAKRLINRGNNQGYINRDDQEMLTWLKTELRNRGVKTIIA